MPSSAPIRYVVIRNLQYILIISEWGETFVFSLSACSVLDSSLLHLSSLNFQGGGFPLLDEWKRVEDYPFPLHFLYSILWSGAYAHYTEAGVLVRKLSQLTPRS